MVYQKVVNGTTNVDQVLPDLPLGPPKERWCWIFIYLAYHITLYKEHVVHCRFILFWGQIFFVSLMKWFKFSRWSWRLSSSPISGRTPRSPTWNYSVVAVTIVIIQVHDWNKLLQLLFHLSSKSMRCMLNNRNKYKQLPAQSTTINKRQKEKTVNELCNYYERSMC